MFMSSTLTRVLHALLLMSALEAAEASAQDCAETFVPPPSNLNVCERLVEALTVEKLVPREVEQCRSGFECIAMPQCCVPGICNAIPECVVTRIVEELVTTVYHAGDVYCDFREIDARDMMTTFLEERFVDPNTGTVAAPVAIGVEKLTQIFRYGEQAMGCRADPLPTPIRQLVNELVANTPGYGWSSADASAIRILPRGGFPSSVLLREGYDAITLGNTVVFRPDLHGALKGDLGFYTARQLREEVVPPLFRQAIDTLVHELVHVRQYRERGERDFLTLYLQQMAFQGYEDAPLEDEAFAWGSEVVHHRGGYYCFDRAPFYAEQSVTRGMDLGVFPCALPTAWVMTIL